MENNKRHAMTFGESKRIQFAKIATDIKIKDSIRTGIT
jgi:hypothetical protein